MALLIYAEMAWVMASPSYLCSHTNVLFMVVLPIFCYRPQSSESLYKLYLNRGKLISGAAIELVLAEGQFGRFI